MKPLTVPTAGLLYKCIPYECGRFLCSDGSEYCRNPPRDGIDGNFCWEHAIESFPNILQIYPWITW